jgi:hypothetical protein
MNLPIKKISAQIIADSINPVGNRITSFILCYPRFIHSELMTHRAFSRNAASSRAIPIKKMVKEVWSNPAMPIRWGKNGKGMQDHGLLTGIRLWLIKRIWLLASKVACIFALLMYWIGVHKQIANRVLEPFAWMVTLVTATEYKNFFALRCHIKAQPEFQHLAYLMLKEYLREEKLKAINWNDWHLPFAEFMPIECTLDQKLQISSARCARLSYMSFDGKLDIGKDYDIYKKLVGEVPGHWSPIEHPAQAVDANFGPYKGWISFRAMQANENITNINLFELVTEYEKTTGIVK